MSGFGNIKKGQMHKDLGKAPGAPITQSDIKREAAKGPVQAKRANFARMAKRHWKPLGEEF
jgi:hypothetical protein